jgi:hypothetical protein
VNWALDAVRRVQKRNNAMELGAERAPNTTANTKDDPAALSFEVIMRLARSEVAEAEIRSHRHCLV